MPVPEGFLPFRRPSWWTGHGRHDLFGCCILDGHREEFFEAFLVHLLHFHLTIHAGSLR
ncbi:hypothetical protein [Streptomyces thermospinosisporus]|uniref:hypothetical protein n=1 Tax=Streptomyces thermospinosisporus TaxID=161482 RepID=UPI0031D5276B